MTYEIRQTKYDSTRMWELVIVGRSFNNVLGRWTEKRLAQAALRRRKNSTQVR